MHKIQLIAFLICTRRLSFLSGIKVVNAEYYYYYDGYVNSLSTRGLNLVLGIEILTIDHFQSFSGFFGTPCIVQSSICEFKILCFIASVLLLLICVTSVVN